jgi:hypothetical protein
MEQFGSSPALPVRMLGRRPLKDGVLRSTG